MLSGRWHDSHFCWKIGATSFVNVTVFESAAAAGSDETRRALNASAVETRNITGSFRTNWRRSEPKRGYGSTQHYRSGHLRHRVCFRLFYVSICIRLAGAVQLRRRRELPFEQGPHVGVHTEELPTLSRRLPVSCRAAAVLHD